MIWRDLVRRGSDPVLLFDRAGRCVFASDAVADVSGPGRPTVGVHFDDLVREPDGSSASGRLDRAHSSGSEFTASLVTADGTLAVRALLTRHTADGWTSMVLALGLDPGEASAALARRLELEHLIEVVQSRFIHTEPHRIADTIGWALEEVGRHLDADRSYVLSFDHEARTETMTHEWVAPGQPSELGEYVDVPWDAAPAASQRNTTLGISAVPDVSALTGEWEADREFFEAAGIRSILELPLVIDAHPVGALGFDWLTHLAEWTEDDLTLLRILASSFAQLLGREAAEAALRHREDHDPLTGLLNRHGVMRALSELLGPDPGSPDIAVLFLDIDDFKVVNDSLGPSFGDRLLAAVGARLREHVRGPDLVARIGGDEFAAVLLADRGAPPSGLSDRVRLAMSDPYVIDGRTYRLTASCGVATTATSEVPRGADGAVELLRRAGAAVVRAKERGRSRQEEFDDALAAEVERRLETDQRLRGALDRGEFEVHYQTEHELATGAVLGAEALLRWRVDGELVPAAEFIEIVESTGLILEVGPWVMHQACSQAAAWIATGSLERFTMRVNLSVRQLEQPDVVDRVREVLDDTGLGAEHLCLEVTETGLMAEPERARRALDQLDGLGVELAIDDFGTGYSSLAYLKRFPFDVLKIDRSFVMGLPHDPEDVAIVRSVIALAEALDMVVTAEGIEDVEQVAALVALGCRRGQGYLFARPVDASEATARVVGRAVSPSH